MIKQAKKFAIKGAVITMALVYALDYFNAAANENKIDIYKENYHDNYLLQILTMLSGLFALYQISEIGDHMTVGHSHGHAHSHGHGHSHHGHAHSPDHGHSHHDHGHSHGGSHTDSCQHALGQSSLGPSIQASASYRKLEPGMPVTHSGTFAKGSHEEHGEDEKEAKTSHCLTTFTKTSLSISAAVLGGFACYALWEQNYDLGRRQLGAAIPLFTVSLIRFVLLPVRHVAAIIKGADSQKKLLQSITQGEHSEEAHMSPGKQFLLFIIYSFCHIADSKLLANASTNPWVNWLGTVGLAGSSSCYHLNHTVNIPSIIQNLKKLPASRGCLAVFSAIVVGGLHACQPSLGLFLLMKSGQSWLIGLQSVAVLGEFVTGAIDASQHLRIFTAPANLSSKRICWEAISCCNDEDADDHRPLLG